MSNFKKVRSMFDDLAYMTERQAAIMRKLITRYDSRDILELGFFHGKSSAYLAAILEDLGRGHLTTIDHRSAREREPSIDHVLNCLRLGHRVNVIYAHRSYTWELSKMIRTTPKPLFDLCYLDGGHTWDDTGFGFVLADMLLRPGGRIVFDDLKWTIDAAIPKQPEVPRSWRACSRDERATPGVRLVFDLLVPHLGYVGRQTAQRGQWGIAQKPADAPRPEESAPGRIERILKALSGR